VFVGDTMYEWAQIVFPAEGDLRLYARTLSKLKDLVEGWNAASGDEGARVKIACGHITSDAKAAELIDAVQHFLDQVLEGQVKAKDEGIGKYTQEPTVSYEREDGRLSFIGPKRIFDQTRGDDEIMATLRSRH
jgi:uncharacterized protein (DUF1786 family)